MKTTPSNVTQIAQMLAQGEKHDYDKEAVSQLAHALQCATLAEDAGRNAEMITACLLHDVGHMIYLLDEDPTNRTRDFRHEDRGAAFLSRTFGPAVTEPIRLHVAAKRYLCYAEPTYWAGLSPVSQHTLELQGGIFTAGEAAAFIAQPYAPDAVQLRRWDDAAKVPGLQTPDLAHFTEVMAACALTQEEE